MNESFSCNIALIPDPDIIATAMAASKRLEQHGGLFILDQTAFYAHASLYMTQIKSEDLNRAGDLLAAIASQTKIIHSVALRYDQTEGFVDAEYVRSPQLIALQERVITAINPMRDGMRPKDQARMARAKGEALQNLTQYGYRNVGGLFRPHITLTRFDNNHSVEVRTLPDPGAFSGQFVSIGLFLMGDHGTCIKKLAEWPLR